MSAISNLNIAKTALIEFPGSGATLSTRVFHIVCTGATVSIVVKGRAKGSNKTYVAIPYKKRFLNGAVADDSFVSAAITDTSIVEVNSAGLDLALDVTYTSGTVTVDSDEMVG